MGEPVRWVVFDYGEVVSRRSTAVPGLAAMIGADPAAFEAAYWAEREGYDRGDSDPAYWGRVAAAAGRTVDDETAAALAEADGRGWLVTAPESLQLLADLHAAGTALAVLSNAPASFARMLEKQDWVRYVAHLVVSGDLGYAKPDAAIWTELLRRLDARPGEVLFLDDKPANVAGARAVGLQAEVWTSAAAARPHLAALGLL